MTKAKLAKAAAVMGRKGGKTKGKAKARTAAQARAAVNERWRRYYAAKDKR